MVTFYGPSLLDNESKKKKQKNKAQSCSQKAHILVDVNQ